MIKDDLTIILIGVLLMNVCAITGGYYYDQFFVTAMLNKMILGALFAALWLRFLWFKYGMIRND